MSTDSALARTVARNVRLLMAVRGMRSQRELAELLRMSEGRLSGKLSGREVWTLTDIERLAEALDTTGSAALRPVRARKRPQSAQEKKAKRLVRARSGGWCELRLPGICVGRAYDFSHRIAAGRGGKWLASNGCDACRFCHLAITNTQGRRAEYERLGYLCRTGADTTRVPVRLAEGRFLLTDDGRRIPAELETRHG